MLGSEYSHVTSHVCSLVRVSCVSPTTGRPQELFQSDPLKLEQRVKRHQVFSELPCPLPTFQIKGNTPPTFYQTPREINLLIPGSPEFSLERILITSPYSRHPAQCPSHLSFNLCVATKSASSLFSIPLLLSHRRPNANQSK